MRNDQNQRAKDLLNENKEGHNQLAELLLEREVIFAEDVEKIFGKRPWVSRSEEIMESQGGGEPDHNSEETATQTVADGEDAKAGASTGDEKV